MLTINRICQKVMLLQFFYVFNCSAYGTSAMANLTCRRGGANTAYQTMKHAFRDDNLLNLQIKYQKKHISFQTILYLCNR